ncbi:ISNCY family transposase [Caldicellulosiruptor morganii]|uniref:ISNCY family transposase n=1 Tax=Caldicellulosiruptor morganii TaxID=1387555 RepID=A0ABY7BQ45_9FIRM|nr:ISNCY family transposase [Caldicellulosiruptor morganii]WAM34968.1 ISNCY family transposase [Caldicellulosiruptor morganii]
MTNFIKAQKQKFLKIFMTIEKVIKDLGLKIKNYKRGRPKKFKLSHIIACFVYKVKNRINSFRELEYKINEDEEFRKTIGIEKSPDHSYFSKWAKMIEEEYIEAIARILVREIDPETRVCAIDSTPLRSSRGDREAGVGRCVSLGFYNGYKLHVLATVEDEVIPIVWWLTCANIHDSKAVELLYEAKIFGPDVILADAGYDCTKWFDVADRLGIKFVAGINKRNIKDFNNVKNILRAQNIEFLRSKEGQRVYKQRIKIERLFGKLKGEYNLEQVRLRGFRTYKRHVDWIMVTYLIELYIQKNENCKFSFKYAWNNL